MASSIWSAIKEIQEVQDRILAGEFPQRSPLGPGMIQTKNIRARAVTAPLIDVQNLEAVNTQTGSLNIDGTVEISTDGRLISGTNTDDFTTFTTSPGGGLGYYLTYHDTYGALMAVGDFNNVTGQYMKWDGTALTIKGVLTASAGAIAGWLITADSIENSGGTVGMASSGHAGYTFWAGDATPASAEFSVTAAGALVATSATITGAITASSGSITGTLTVGGSGGLNLSSAGGKVYSGQSTFNTGTGFHLANSGGTGVFSIGEGSGGARHLYYDGANLVIKGTINATAGAFTGAVTIGTGGSISSGQTGYNTGTGWWLDFNAGTPRFSIGNGSTEALTWNGTALAVRGTITADDGTLGTLAVSGALTLGTGGRIESSGASYGSSGIYIDYNAGTPRMSMGSKLTWDGSTLSIDGALTSTSGTIGGWTIDSTNGLKLGTTSTTRGIHTGSTAFYAGNATPGSAPFRVSTAGALVATDATITGGITASSLTITGTANFSGGSMTLPGGGTITSSTLDLNSGTMAGLTVDGNITLGSGGKIIDADGSYWDQNGIVLVGTGSLGDTIRWEYSGWASNRPYSYLQSAGSSSLAQLFMGSAYGNGSAYSNNIGMSFTANSTIGALDIFGDPTTHPATVSSGAQTGIRIYSSDTNTTSNVSGYVHGRALMELVYTDYGAKFGGRIFPGGGAGSYQTTRYIADNGTYMDFQGPVNVGNATVGGSAANWSTFGTANIPDQSAGYVKVYINGTLSRIPFYADG